MNKNKRNLKCHIDHTTDSIADPGANGGFTELVRNTALQNIIESIRSEDGIHMDVKTMTFNLRIYSEEPFLVVPVLIQTAGTVTETDDQTASVIGELIAATCDDVFGYDRLGPAKSARRVPTADNDDYGLEISIPLPNYALQILNKETETERLQNLYIAICGKGTNAFAINLIVDTITEYREQRKTLILR
jgi:hypothetical protein